MTDTTGINHATDTTPSISLEEERSQKRARTDNGSSAKILLGLSNTAIVEAAENDASLRNELIEFCDKLKSKLTTLKENEKSSTGKNRLYTKCCGCGETTRDLSKCSCFFEVDGVYVSGILLCQKCIKNSRHTNLGKPCDLCGQLLCLYKDGCEPLKCGDCDNIMCSVHPYATDGSCYKACMCGKKLWCTTCSKSIDAQVKSGISTDCADCHRVSCGLPECTIYKDCRLCYKRLCENCVFRTPCDCDPTLPLCDDCVGRYVCPNPNCLGPADDNPASELSELAS